MDFLLETLGRIGFDWRMGLFNLINFLVIIWILKRFLFQPMMKVINERQQKSEQAVENFQKSKTELDMAHRKAQELVDESKVQANKVIETANKQAATVAETMREKAHIEIEKLVEQAKRNIEIDKKEMREALRAETVTLVVLAVEKIMKEKLNDTQDEAFIADILDSLKK